MNKLVAGWMVLFFLLSALSGMMDGSATVMASTKLAQALDEADLHAHVTSTVGFIATNGVIVIRGEKIFFTAQAGGNEFTGLSRGYENTVAATYEVGVGVYPEELAVINKPMGYDAIMAVIPGGQAGVIGTGLSFILFTVPKVISWDYSFLTGDLLPLRYLLTCVSIGFIVYLASVAVNTIMGILSVSR